MSTRDKIMDVALHMFSERGYEAVSIRDICGEVGIKESTLYYHFKNKKDILDSLVAKFKAHIDSLLVHVDEITAQPQKKKNKKNDDIGAQMMDSYMMDSYLFDPFCNLMLRLMMIEQFHNEEIRALYEKTLFTDPYEIQLEVFNRLATAGTIPADVFGGVHVCPQMVYYCKRIAPIVVGCQRMFVVIHGVFVVFAPICHFRLCKVLDGIAEVGRIKHRKAFVGVAEAYLFYSVDAVGCLCICVCIHGLEIFCNLRKICNSWK